MALRVGTFNTFNDSPSQQKAIAVDAWLEHVDIGGLQEFGGPEDHRYLLAKRKEGWDFNEGASGAPPVIWRTDRLDLQSVHSVMLSHGGRVNHIPGSRDRQGPIFANVLRLRDLNDMKAPKHILFVNFHNYSHWISHPIPSPRFHLAMEAVQTVCGLVHDPIANKMPTFVVADFNDAMQKATSHTVKRFRAAGLNGAWQQHRPNHPTHGKISFDSILSNVPCRKAVVIVEPHVGDHRGVWGLFG